MAWIKTISPEDADQQLKEVYDRITSARGKLSNIMHVQSLDPRALQAHLDLYVAVMFGPSGLSRAERELVAIVVSSINGCAYCIRHHAAALNALWKDAARVETLSADYEKAELSAREWTLANYAARLTRTPPAIDEDDISQLRAQGLTDADILKLNMIVSYFNFVNRLAEGLGVEFTEQEASGYRY